MGGGDGEEGKGVITNLGGEPKGKKADLTALLDSLLIKQLEVLTLTPPSPPALPAPRLALSSPPAPLALPAPPLALTRPKPRTLNRGVNLRCDLSPAHTWWRPQVARGMRILAGWL